MVRITPCEQFHEPRHDWSTSDISLEITSQIDCINWIMRDKKCTFCRTLVMFAGPLWTLHDLLRNVCFCYRSLCFVINVWYSKTCLEWPLLMSRKSGLSRQVQWGWNATVDRNFTDWKLVFPGRVVFPEGVIPDRFDCIMYMHDFAGWHRIGRIPGPTLDRFGARSCVNLLPKTSYAPACPWKTHSTPTFAQTQLNARTKRTRAGFWGSQWWYVLY